MLLSIAFDEFMNSRHRAASTRLKYRHRLAELLARHGQQDVEKIQPADLFLLFDYLEGRGLAEASLAVHRSAMLALFNFCVAEGYCARNPVERIKKYSDRPPVVRLPPVGDVCAVLDVCRAWSRGECALGRRDAAILFLAATSAKRRGEVQALKLAAVVRSLAQPVEPGVYAVATSGKTGAARLVFNGEGAGMLRRWLDVRPEGSDALWVTTTPGPLYGQAIGERVMGMARRRICEAAGVPLITYQQLRRLRATQVGRAFGLHVAAEVLGHRSGVSVIRDFYYNPAVELSDRAVIETARDAGISQG